MGRASHAPRRKTRALVALVTALSCTAAGCVQSNYKLVKNPTPPAPPVNAEFQPAAPLQAVLVGMIVYHGAGSWKQDALWDEYVVALQNVGDRPITIGAAELTDEGGAPVAAGSDPWALEKQSKKLEKLYAATGFVRNAGAVVLQEGVTQGLIDGGLSLAYAAPPVAAAALVAGLLVQPVSIGVNLHNKHRVMAEFARRRLALPLTLAPGEVRAGSLFYPMVRSPRALAMRWSSGSATGEEWLTLDFLRGLHVPASAAGAAPRQDPAP